MRRLFCILIVFLCCLNLYTGAGAKSENIKELYSLSAALIDGETGRVLYGKEEYVERPMASTTKIMTLILALEYGSPGDVVTVSEYAAKMPDVKMRVKKGEQYYLKDMLYAMILESYNDAAVVIAEHIGGSANDFADMMNDKAKEIGLKNTYFITSNGLDAENEIGIHHTTAYDLALLMRYCVMKSPKKEEFIDICQTRSYTFNDYSGKRIFVANNKNRLLDMLDGVLAGKTGFTGDAGYCYTAAIEYQGKIYIIALLGCGWPNNRSYKWSDSKKLFSYAKENYERSCLLNNEIDIPNIHIKDGIEKDEIGLYTDKDVCAVVSEEDKVKYRYNIPKYIKAPVYEGDIIGSIEVYVNNYLVGGVNVYSRNTVNKKDYFYFLKNVFFQTLF